MSRKTSIQRSFVDLFERRALKLLRKHHVTKPPIPVKEIAEGERIAVRFQPFHGETDVSAVLKRDGDTAVIGVNSAHSAKRQRFSIAHELGHFFLHPDENLFVDFGDRLNRSASVKYRNTLSSQATDSEEIEANRFAATLLMPSSFIRRCMESMLEATPDISADEAVEKLAQDFFVSRQAMEFRLLNLGYLVKLDN
jgi:Zn-dependent peptidase ImmA (M78 family)